MPSNTTWQHFRECSVPFGLLQGENNWSFILQRVASRVTCKQVSQQAYLHAKHWWPPNLVPPPSGQAPTSPLVESQMVIRAGMIWRFQCFAKWLSLPVGTYMIIVIVTTFLLSRLSVDHNYREYFKLAISVIVAIIVVIAIIAVIYQLQIQLIHILRRSWGDGQ